METAETMLKMISCSIKKNMFYFGSYVYSSSSLLSLLSVSPSLSIFVGALIELDMCDFDMHMVL